MVKSTCILHTSSHPDKYNNSVNRIISKEEEREDIQGEILQSSTYRINSTTRNTTTSRLIPCRHLPVTVPRASKHSTRQNKTPSSPTSIPGPYSTGRLPVNSTWQKQHSKRQPASMQPLQDTLGAFLQNSTRRNRILSKRVKYCMSMQY